MKTSKARKRVKDKARRTNVTSRQAEPARDKADPHRTFWEQRFPTKSTLILEVLQPFYEWKPELRPALPDLKERVTGLTRVVYAKDACTYRASEIVSLVRMFPSKGFYSDEFLKPLSEKISESSKYDADQRFSGLLAKSIGHSLSRSLGALRTSISEAFSKSCRDSLQESLTSPLKKSLRESVWTPLKKSLLISLHASLRFSLGNSLDAALLEMVDSSLGNSLEETAWELLWSPIETSLYQATWFAIAESPTQAAYYKQLHELWLLGNFPIGTDKDHNLLVLVAD